MEELFEFINKKTNNKFKDLLFFAGEYDVKNKKLELSFNVVTDSYEDIKNQSSEIEKLVNEFFKNQLVTEVKIKHLKFDEELCLTKVKNFFTDRPELKFVLNVDNIYLKKSEYENYEIVLPMKKEFFSGKLEKDFTDFINDYFSKYGEETPEICFEKAKTIDVEKVLSDRINAINEQVILQEENVKLEDVENVLGEVTNTNETILATDKLEVVKNISVCGVINRANIREFTKNDKTKKMLSFSLVDGNKKVDCVCFSKEIEKIENIDKWNDKEAVVLADVDNYNEKISLKVKSVAFCKIIRPEIKFKSVNKDYITIKPEKFEELAQSNFLMQANEIKCEQLKNKSYVIFDLDTTGLDTNKCNIIEIGAVKVEKGKITETFETLINPKEHIPDDATKVNHITDEMVMQKPTIEQVIGDFYKFCYGCTLVGHNSKGYDMPILKRVGFDNRYDFSNEQMDTYEMAKKCLRGLSKYKLGFLCEYLDISLEGAHRALNDTVATAKLFINLMEKYY